MPDGISLLNSEAGCPRAGRTLRGCENGLVGEFYCKAVATALCRISAFRAPRPRKTEP